MNPPSSASKSSGSVVNGSSARFLSKASAAAQPLSLTWNRWRGRVVWDERCVLAASHPMRHFPGTEGPTSSTHALQVNIDVTALGLAIGMRWQAVGASIGHNETSSSVVRGGHCCRNRRNTFSIPSISRSLSASITEKKGS